MKRLFLLLLCMVVTVGIATAQSDYYTKKSQNYQREAEYYRKKADGYRREAAYYLKKAQGYQRDVAYYTKRSDIDVQRHTLVMLRMRWINTKHNCVMRLRQITERQCI